jgi:hypothetical protein
MAGTIKVVDAKDGGVKEVAAEAAQQGFATGALRLPKDIDVPLTGTDGKTTYFPAEHVAAAIQEGGFRFADSKAQAQMRAEDAPVQAFVENLANDLVPIPGVVHGLQRALGADPEDLAARAETGWGKAGSYLGMAGSLLTGGLEGRAASAAVTGARKLGTQVAETALEKAAPGFVERNFLGRVGGQMAADAAEGVEKLKGRVGRFFGGPVAVEPLEGAAERGLTAAGRAALANSMPGYALNKAAQEATGVAERVIGDQVQNDIARKALASGFGRALEGATYGVAHAVDEASLGNADLNAETILSSAGAGALVGGLTGYVGRAGVEKAKSIAHNYVAEDITGKIAGSVIGHAVSGGAGGAIGGRVAGQRVSQIIKATPGFEPMAKYLQKADDYLANRILRLAGANAPQYRPPVEALIARTTLNMLSGSAAERRDAYDQRIAELTSLRDPQVYARHVEPELESMADAPNHQMATSLQGQKIIDFLTRQVPAAQGNGTMNDLFYPGKKSPTQRPDDRAIRDFADLDRLVQHPNHIFDLADRGVVRPVHVKALQELYPQTYARIQQNLMEQLPHATETITAPQRRSIKVLLGGETVSPQVAQLRQQVFAPQEPTQGPSLTPAQQTKAIKAEQTLSQNLEFEE